MYELSITKIRYPKNETNIYEYKSLDGLLMELKKWLIEKKIYKNDIIRIEKIKEVEK